MTELYDIEVETIDGNPKRMEDYKGQVVLVVNVASKCGLTPQYEQLETLYDEKKSQGFEVLGFPCNQFAGQEPGTEQEIEQFCRSNFGVQFQMMSKVAVNGEHRHPLYQHLVQAQPEAIRNPDSKLEALLKDKGLASERAEDIMWNFEKFLIGRDGQVLARFAPDVTAEDKVLVNAVDDALAE